MNRRYLFSMMFVGFLIVGCAHSLEITNADDYFPPPSPPPKESVRLGITSNSDSHAQNSRYVGAIVDALQRTGNFGKVIYPYSQAIHQDQVDTVVDITVNPRYSGRGSNFFVNWPGFLIWAPAIWGYGYIAEIETAVTITRLKEGSQQVAVPAKYKFRQAEMDRTWSAEVGGWVLPYTAVAFLGGIFVTQYDADVTGEFITKVLPSYGPYVAKKIMAALQ